MLPKIKKEALLNEYKGNLLEYLVGESLARYFLLEISFYESLNQDLKERLKTYETFLRDNDEDLLKKLPEFANLITKNLIDVLPQSILEVFVVGKLTSRKELEGFQETDILLKYNNDNKEEFLPISLKFCKANSFVNTKSGGVKSFFKKYFSSLSKSQEIQEKVNEFIHISFLDMAHELYEMAGLDFLGSFDESFTDAGFSELPGELGDEMSERLMQYYSQVIEKFYEAFETLLKEDKKSFLKSLMPLLGVGIDNLMQVILFYESSADKRYINPSVLINESLSLNDLEKNFIEISKLEENKSSFEIKFKKFILQIRVKPMNKFTQESMKVNCSVKYRNDLFKTN